MNRWFCCKFGLWLEWPSPESTPWRRVTCGVEVRAGADVTQMSWYTCVSYANTVIQYEVVCDLLFLFLNQKINSSTVTAPKLHNTWLEAIPENAAKCKAKSRV